MFPSLRKHLLQVRRQQEQQQHAAVSADSADDTDSADSADDVDEAAPATAETAVEPVVVAVPGATNVGPDGYLPGVSDILGGATKTLQSIDSQAAVLQAQLAQKQREDQEELAKKKATFEQKLKDQEADNRMVVAANAKIEGEIEALKKGNGELHQKAQHLEKANHVMRSQLHTLKAKFDDVQVFAGESLKESDDSQAKELDVLRTHKKKVGLVVREVGIKSVDDDDKDEDDDDEDDDRDDKPEDKDDNATSFLEVAASESMEFDDAPPTPTADPKGLVEILRSGVEQLAKEGRESDQKLHAMFLASFRAGVKRHAALLLKQRSLVSQRTELQLLQQELAAADKHLTATGVALQERLRGLGLFAQRLVHLALAPSSEVPHLLDSLPARPERAAAPEASN